MAQEETYILNAEEIFIFITELRGVQYIAHLGGAPATNILLTQKNGSAIALTGQ
jgi:hypothetical protein